MCLPVGTIVTTNYNTGPYEIVSVTGPCHCPKYIDTLGDGPGKAKASASHYHFTCKDLRDNDKCWLNGYAMYQGRCLSVWDNDELITYRSALVHDRVKALTLTSVYKILLDRFNYRFTLEHHTLLKVVLHCGGNVETEQANKQDLEDIAWLEANAFVRTERIDCRNREVDRFDNIIYHYQRTYAPVTALDRAFLKDYHAEKFGKLDTLRKYHIIPELFVPEKAVKAAKKDLSVQKPSKKIEPKKESFREHMGLSLPPAGAIVEVKRLAGLQWFIKWIDCPDGENVLYAYLPTKATAEAFVRRHGWSLQLPLFQEETKPEPQKPVRTKKQPVKSSLKKGKKAYRMEFRYDDDFKNLLQRLRERFPDQFKDETNTGIIEHCCYAFSVLNPTE